MTTTFQIPTPEEIAEQEREQAKRLEKGQPLYAKIKRSSKYYSQNSYAKAEPQRWGGFPFKVTIDPRYGDYCVQGGPGGQYRLSDVNIVVVVDGLELRIA